MKKKFSTILKIGFDKLESRSWSPSNFDEQSGVETTNLDWLEIIGT